MNKKLIRKISIFLTIALLATLLPVGNLLFVSATAPALGDLTFTVSNPCEDTELWWLKIPSWGSYDSTTVVDSQYKLVMNINENAYDHVKINATSPYAMPSHFSGVSFKLFTPQAMEFFAGVGSSWSFNKIVAGVPYYLEVGGVITEYLTGTTSAADGKFSVPEGFNGRVIIPKTSCPAITDFEVHNELVLQVFDTPIPPIEGVEFPFEFFVDDIGTYLKVGEPTPTPRPTEVLPIITPHANVATTFTSVTLDEANVVAAGNYAAGMSYTATVPVGYNGNSVYKVTIANLDNHYSFIGGFPTVKPTLEGAQGYSYWLYSPQAITLGSNSLPTWGSLVPGKTAYLLDYVTGAITAKTIGPDAGGNAGTISIPAGFMGRVFFPYSAVPSGADATDLGIAMCQWLSPASYPCSIYVDDVALYKFNNPGIKGDADKNGTVELSDLAAIKASMIKLSPLVGLGYYTADVTNDDKVSISDLLALKKTLIGI